MIRLTILAPADRQGLTDARRVRRLTRLALQLVGACGILLIAMYGGAWELRRQADARRATPTSGSSNGSSLAAVQMEVAERAALLRSVVETAPHSLDVVFELMRAVPPSVSLSNLTFDNTANRITLSGAASERSQALALVSALQSLESVAAVNAPLSSLAPRDDVPFTIEVRLKSSP